MVDVLGKKASAPFRDVGYTGEKIIIDPVSVAIKDSHGNELYDKKEMKRYFQPLFRLMHSIKESELVMNNMKKGDLKTWLGIIIGIPIIIAIFYLELM